MPASRLPVTTPVSIVAVITIAIAISATDEIVVAMSPVTSENVRESRTTIGSTSIPTTVTCIVTVNKLFALLIPVRISPAAATSLAHRICRRAEDQQQTHYQDSQKIFRCPKFHKGSSKKIIGLMRGLGPQQGKRTNKSDAAAVTFCRLGYYDCVSNTTEWSLWQNLRQTSPRRKIN